MGRRSLDCRVEGNLSSTRWVGRKSSLPANGYQLSTYRTRTPNEKAKTFQGTFTSTSNFVAMPDHSYNNTTAQN